MYQPLAPCPSCHRHVRAAHAGSACPFCGVALTAVTTIPSATQRLARGALFAFASTVVACGGNTAPEPTTETGATLDARADVLDSGNVAPPYGIPPDDGSVDDTGGPVAEYGAPPPDGSVDDSGDPMADYGAPPPPDAK